MVKYGHINCKFKETENTELLFLKVLKICSTCTTTVIVGSYVADTSRVCLPQVWDIQDQNCLLTVRPKGHKIRGDLMACHYSTVSKSLAVATDQMNGLPLRLRSVWLRCTALYTAGIGQNFIIHLSVL